MGGEEVAIGSPSRSKIFRRCLDRAVKLLYKALASGVFDHTSVFFSSDMTRAIISSVKVFVVYDESDQKDLKYGIMASAIFLIPSIERGLTFCHSYTGMLAAATERNFLSEKDQMIETKFSALMTETALRFPPLKVLFYLANYTSSVFLLHCWYHPL